VIDVVNPHRMPPADRLYGLPELALFLGGSHDSWTGDFLRLVAKSDRDHRTALHRAFPVHVRAYELWQRLTDPTVASLTEALVTDGTA
jgi:hypothetical protein